jgi:UDP-N-acetylmuramate--alanine ligase
MLVEACEYRANFLHLHPQQAVILGIDHDHFDCFDTLGDVERAFRKFAARIPNDGLILAQHDCQITRRVTDGLMCRTETFGFDQAADWSARSTVSPARQGGDDAADGTYPRAYAQGSPDEASVLPVSSHGQDGPGRCVQPGCSAFAVHHRGRHLVDVQLRLPGRHNVLNALAAAALAWHNGVAPARIARGLASFRGLHRRLERLGTWRGTTLIDDYAHHPTEVAVSLETVRQMYPERRVFCVFQPHQALRTARLLDELAASLHNAHWVAVADIFRAREGPFRSGEVTAADLARRVQGLLTVEVATVHRLDEIARVLENRLRPGDVLVTLGAGDIARIYDGFLEESRESRAAG